MSHANMNRNRDIARCSPVFAHVVRRSATVVRNAIFALLALLPVSVAPAADHDSHRVATWATASNTVMPFDALVPTFNDTTLRQVGRVSMGGDGFRVGFTNEFGTAPLNIGEAGLTLRDTNSAIADGSDRMLTFGGKSSIDLVASADADAPLIGLIVKTEANPFFVTMMEGAQETTRGLGVDLRTFAGEHDGDTETQADAVRTLVAAGAQGILITPSDPATLAGAVARAREAGVLVVALDTPFDPADAADATFATDNFRAGELIGRWARAKLGEDAENANVATLDGTGTQVTLEVMRNQGFLKGFGIDLGDPARMYDEDDSRIVGHGTTQGTEAGGHSAMEELLRAEPVLDVVYVINEPAATGAHVALKAAGRDRDVLIVTVDGGCPGVGMVAAEAFGATAMQFPVRMATLGVEAVVEFLETGREPVNSPGLDFHDTGVALVTDEPLPEVPSISTERASKECWG